MRNAQIGLAAFPVILIVLLSFAPSTWLDPYAWWDPIQLNNPNQSGRPRRWLNMGLWEKGVSDYSSAAENLGRHLLEFADAPESKRILDVAHGAGESLLLHLARTPAPHHVDALAPLQRDTQQARSLVESYLANHTKIKTKVGWHTAHASYSATNSQHNDHPLNPMRGFLGRTSSSSTSFEENYEEEAELQPHHQSDSSTPLKYDLIYVLDAIYHFPPSKSTFLASALNGLNPGGVVAYTDIIPPAGLTGWKSRIISRLLSVPLVNIQSRPESLRHYRREVVEMGFDDVRLEDVSMEVWEGFSRNLMEKGGVWYHVGKIVAQAGKEGWRFLIVRARRPLNVGDDA